VESILQATPSTTYSLLMNSSKTCNKSHLSIHLSIYVTQTCTWGHGPCTWFSFFGNFNCQTLSICYPGSIWIEKIKLLGASNLLTDWHCSSYLNIEYHHMLTWSCLLTAFVHQLYHRNITCGNITPSAFKCAHKYEETSMCNFLWYNWWTNAVNRQTSS
jgi:hypothetical protein